MKNALLTYSMSKNRGTYEHCTSFGRWKTVVYFLFSMFSVAVENLKSCKVSANNCHGPEKKGPHSTQYYIQALQPSI